MPISLIDDYRAMLRIRRFELRIEQLVAEQRLAGTVHLYLGQEAVAVGVCGELRQTDLAVSTHRGHGHLLAKGGDCGKLMAELAGRLAGYCRGKGGTQHVSAVDVGFMGSNGITGGGIPIAVGLALAKRNLGTDDVVISFLGDGSVTTGAFHESLNLAALWNVRVLFVCENNGYAMSNPVSEAVSTQNIPEWASRYGNMPTMTVDGNDITAVREATMSLIDTMRETSKPAFLECMTYRQCGHSRSDARVYRSRDEEKEWRLRDPLKLAEALLDQADIDEAKASVAAEIAAAEEFTFKSPMGDISVALGGVFAPEESE